MIWFNLSWIFKSMSAATVDATASAANKTCKAETKRNNWGSLAPVNDYYYCTMPVGVSQVFQAHHFSFKDHY